MAIDAYVGLPGHGKSYGVTEHVIIPSIKEGRHVVTNVPMEREDLLADFGVPGSELTQLPEDWFERPDLADLVPKGCVLVLDELWRRWPSGLKSNDALLADKSLLAEHRHRVDDKGRSMRVVLVSQDLAQLASWVRLLVEQTYRMTKLTAIGSTKKFRVDIYQGAPTGQNPPKSRLIRQTFGSYKKEIYRYYSSATQSATGSVGDESKADGRGNLLKSPMLIAGFVLPVLLIPVLIWYVYGYFFGRHDAITATPEPVAVVTAVDASKVNPPPPGMETLAAPGQFAQPAAVAAVNPPPPAESALWRVGGYIRRGTSSGSSVQAWRSETGYGGEPEQREERKFMPDMIVLHSEIAGIRYMLASECEPFPDGINWHCPVDGAIATPWSGRGGTSTWATDGTLAQRTVNAAADGRASGATVAVGKAPTAL
ncbi:zonular occludens toxin domain-containing protein [Pseudomonas sp. UBA6310]|uniref:zonular occludens toxin domain-containing protein n=1 Tax=Pseudomonas sp. UBA6310 TaxID=1947327 RepID=UPI00257D4F6E|nr:zonular occludens toxin domain-containing protein [Pseudomonas sp. UBA6310]